MAESSGGSSHYCVACKKRVTVRVHKLPCDESLREIWISRICQSVEVEDSQLSQKSRICANHFLPSDYKKSKDTNKWRKRTSPAKQQLKDDAVPSVFTSFTPRPTKFASAEARSDQNLRITVLKVTELYVFFSAYHFLTFDVKNLFKALEAFLTS